MSMSYRPMSHVQHLPACHLQNCLMLSAFLQITLSSSVNTSWRTLTLGRTNHDTRVDLLPEITQQQLHLLQLHNRQVSQCHQKRALSTYQYLAPAHHLRTPLDPHSHLTKCRCISHHSPLQLVYLSHPSCQPPLLCLTSVANPVMQSNQLSFSRNSAP